MLYRIYILVFTWLTYCKMWDVWKGEPGWRTCCCTDAVVDRGLRMVQGLFLRTSALWQTEEQRWKNITESVSRGRALVMLHVTTGNSGSPFCVSLKPDTFVCVCVFVRSSDWVLVWLWLPCGIQILHSSLIWLGTTSWESLGVWGLFLWTSIMLLWLPCQCHFIDSCLRQGTLYYWCCRKVPGRQLGVSGTTSDWQLRAHNDWVGYFFS